MPTPWRLTFCACISLLLSPMIENSVGSAPAEGKEKILLQDDFEAGGAAPDGWSTGANLPGVEYVYDKKNGSGGKRSLSIQKSAKRYFPIAQWYRKIPHRSDSPVLKLAVKVKASRVTKSIVDVMFLDAGDKSIHHEWVAYIGQEESQDPVATHAWKDYGGAVEIPDGTKQILIAFQTYGPGKIWFDDLVVHYADSTAGANRPDLGSAPKRPTIAPPKTPSPTPLKLASGSWTRYILHPPTKQTQPPPNGYPVLFVLPGGTGSTEFYPFVHRIHEDGLNGQHLIIQPIAPPQIVWPTQASQGRFASTEASLAGILEEVAKTFPIDRKQVRALAWSSSGPAVYASLLHESSPLTGAFIAMSVFRSGDLPPLKNASGKNVFLLHSPSDQTCPYAMAQNAEKQLNAAGVGAKLVDYEGGHGWHGPVYDHIRTGLQWLRDNGS